MLRTKMFKTKTFYQLADFQKLEREARICRKLQHPNIGKKKNLYYLFFDVLQTFFIQLQ